MKIQIQKTLSQNGNANLDDVLAIKQALTSMGHYEVPKYGYTPYPDKTLFEAIKSFQKDEGLEVDGIMKPDGPTIKKLNEKLTDRDPEARSPTIWCPQCGAPHGGSKGDLCPDCFVKQG